jgi:hypothetical protein
MSSTNNNQNPTGSAKSVFGVREPVTSEWLNMTPGDNTAGEPSERPEGTQCMGPTMAPV